MNWERLISDRRLGLEELHDNNNQIRSDFQRDYDRLIFSSPFRRLQNKTQVFPLPGSVFVHNRLTHSLEVSTVGRSLSKEVIRRLEHINKQEFDLLKHIPDIVATACLCHDLGNPPFGHSGEKTISTWFSEGPGVDLKNHLSIQQWMDFVNFEGNANSFRLLTNQFVGRRKGGFAMTYSTLGALIKYPWSSEHAGYKGKFGYFQSEESTYRKVAEWLDIPELSNGVFARHPLVYLMEAADDICYQIMDIEDAHRLGILTTKESTLFLLNFFDADRKGKLERGMNYLTDPNEKIGYLRSAVIGETVESCADTFVYNLDKIMSGEHVGSLVDIMADKLANAYRDCSAMAYERIYCAPDVVDVDLAGHRILTYLLDKLMDAVLNPEKNYSKLLLSKMPKQYDINSPTLYGRIQAVLDHISGMTDVYALDLFRKLNGHSLPAV
ncbi:MAG: deoxyguanosinetriphosphate triphosphohydrolase [Muribaculaceae bacterium]|nr:deoxyguanosinetriphosphate triphosphohydrolase [Muribaculaceae bacterium]